MKGLFKIILIHVFIVFYCFGSSIDIENSVKNNIQKAKKYSHKNLDSLNYFAHKAIIAIPKLPNQKIIADYFYDIGDVYLRAVQLDTAAYYYGKSLQIRMLIEDYTGVGAIKNKFGYIAWMQNDGILANEYYQEAINLHKIHGDKKELGKAQNNLANLYTRWGDYKKSINLFVDAMRNYQYVDFHEGVAWLNYSVAILYKRVGDYDKSLQHSKTALKMYSEMADSNKDSTGVQMCYNQLGFIYTHHFDSLELGLKYQLEALRLSQKSNIKPMTADALTGVGQTYYKMRKFQLAKNYIKEAYKLRLENQNLSGTASNLKFLGYIEAEKNNYPKAIAYYDSALVRAIELNHKNIISDLYLAYSKIYEQQKDYQKALKYYHDYITLKDSIVSGEIAKEVSSVELKYEIERQIKENEYLASQNQIQQLTINNARSIRNILILSVIAILLVLIIVIFLYNKQRQIKTLKGLIPICASCKKIRNDKGIYEQIEHYISKHIKADFSHGICPDCMQKLHPEIYAHMNKENYFQK